MKVINYIVWMLSVKSMNVIGNIVWMPDIIRYGCHI